MDADDIAIGAIIGSGSFAEVRRGWLKGGVQGLDGVPVETQTAARVRKRAEGRNAESPEIALKVLRDVRRQTLKRFWFEVLIMKVSVSGRCWVIG